LICWIKHQKRITTGLEAPDKKAITCYSRLVIKVCLRNWFLVSDEDTLIDFPKVQLVQEREKKKTIDEWSQSLEIVVNQKFINEHR
jgi:hypothetical protein